MLLLYFSIFIIFLSVVTLIIGLFNFFSEFATRKKVKFILKSEYREKENFLKTAYKIKKIEKFLAPVFKYSIDNLNDQSSEASLKFIHAGLIEQKSQLIFLSFKFFSLLLIPTLVLFLSLFFGFNYTKTIFLTLLAGYLGFLIPELYLKYRTKLRKKEIQNFLPDFIDLMVMCTLAGLGIDATLNRVSIEMVKICPSLANEFHLCCLEIRAGTSRIFALKSLAKRVHLDEFNTFISMLVQADKFGTSLSSSMEIQSEFMRVKRMQTAEELASKIPVKMLLPLIFFIFPILMFVLVGPAIIQMTQTPH